MPPSLRPKPEAPDQDEEPARGREFYALKHCLHQSASEGPGPLPPLLLLRATLGTSKAVRHGTASGPARFRGGKPTRERKGLRGAGHPALKAGASAAAAPNHAHGPRVMFLA